MRLALSADAFDDLFETVWSEVGKQKVAKLLSNESDVRSTSYYLLRQKLEPLGYRVWSDWRLEQPPHQKIDIGIAIPKGAPDAGKLWIAMEFKGIWPGRYAKALEDIDKLRRYKERTGERIERSYFCYSSSLQVAEEIREVIYPSPSEPWARSYLRIAEGFDESEDSWKVMKY